MLACSNGVSSAPRTRIQQQLAASSAVSPSVSATVLICSVVSTRNEAASGGVL